MGSTQDDQGVQNVQDVQETKLPPPATAPPETTTTYTIDGLAVHPASLSNSTSYKLSREIDPSREHISIYRIPPGASLESEEKGTKSHKEILYDFFRQPLDEVVEINSKRRGALSAQLVIKKRKFLKAGWDIFGHSGIARGTKDTKLFKARPPSNKKDREGSIRWMDHSGSLLAQEEPTEAQNYDNKPTIIIQQQLDLPELDALITTWCAKVWLEAQRKQREAEEQEARKSGNSKMRRSFRQASDIRKDLFGKRGSQVARGGLW